MTASIILNIPGDQVSIVPEYKNDIPIAGGSWAKSLAKTKLIPSKGLLYGIYLHLNYILYIALFKDICLYPRNVK